VSQTIDDRIVSLEFDNKQFEKNVEDTLRTLEKLKKSLNLDNAANNLSAITDAGKKVDLSTVATSVDNLSEKFSTLRLVGIMALSNIVDGAMQMAKKVGSLLMAPFNQIKSGGWARAMKIEDAKFQLEGLQVTWDSIKDDINYGVQDTAYGLDAAASAASQLVASGVRVGDSMKKALRGISGVAAMTNSSFEEISPIFTTVAGQGKLMTMQLRQLESRGLNAAATLGKSLGKSEAEIRDMVQKGKIDFATFAKAMDDAFGQHAKDANKTFAGALSNIKAALSKIGAEFATPLINNAVPVLNAIRLMINAIKDNMSGVFNLFSGVTKMLGNNLTSKIEGITQKIKSFKANGLTEANDALRILLASLLRIAKVISTSFKSVFGHNDDGTARLRSFGQALKSIASALYPSESALKGFGVVLTTLFTIIKKVGEVIGWVLTRIGAPALKILIRIIDIIFSLIGKLGSLVSMVIEVIRNFNNFDGIIRTLAAHGIDLTDKADRLRIIFDKLRSVISKVGSIARTALRYIAIGVAAIVTTPIYLLYTGFQKLISMDWSRFISGITNAKNLIVELFNRFKQLEVVQAVVNGLKTGIEFIVGGVLYLGSVIAEFFKDLANGEITVDSLKTKILSIPDALRTAGSKISEFFSGKRFFASIGDNLKKIGSKILTFVITVKEAIKGLTPAKIMLLAFAGSITLLTLKANAIGTSLFKLVEFARTYTEYLVRIKNPISKFITTIGTLANAILAVAAAIYVLSNVKDLDHIAIVLGAFIGGLLLVGTIYSIVGKAVLKDNGKGMFAQFSKDMALMSVGVFFIASALAHLNDLDTKGAWKRLGVVLACIIVLEAINVALTKFNLVGGGIKTLLSFVGYAIALWAAANALKKLDGVDLSKLKSSWPELLAIFAGLAILARVISGIGTGMLTGAIAFLIAYKVLTKKTEKVIGEINESSDNIGSIANVIKEKLNQIKKNINDIFKGIKEAFKADFWGTVADILPTLAIAAIAIAGIVIIFRRINGSFRILSKEGKYAKRAGKGLAIIALSIGALLVVCNFIAENIAKNPQLMEYMTRLALIIGGLIVAVGLLARLGIGEHANPKYMQQVRRMFSSLSLVILSMTAFMAIAGDLTEDQFNRAYNALKGALIVIGIFSSIIAIASSFSKASKAGFGTFAGITLLFASMVGTLAWLMIILKDPEDYVNLAVGVIAITTLMWALSRLMESIAKIKYKSTPKTILALIAGVIIIGGAIAGLVRVLPDNGYVGKIAALSLAMIGVMASLIAMMGAIDHFAKSTKFSVTKTSQKTIMESLKVLGVLVGALVVSALSLFLLKDANPGSVLASAGSLILIVGALSAISLALLKLSKGNSIADVGTILAMLGGLSVIFGVLSLVVAGMLKLGTDPMQALLVGGAIELLLIGLTAIMKICSMISLEGAKALLALPMLLGLTIIFGVLGVIIGIMVKMGTDPMKALLIGGAIELLMLGLVAIMGVCSMISLLGLKSLLALPMLLGLSLIFGVLGVIIGIMVKMGTDPMKALKIGGSIELLLLGLVGIMTVLGLVSLLGVASLLSIIPLTILIGVFTLLAIIVDKIADLKINASSMSKVDMITDTLWALVRMMTALASLSVGAVGMVAGVAGIIGIVFAISKLMEVLAQMDNVSYNNIATGLDYIAQALNMFFGAAEKSIALCAGLVILCGAIIALGLGCIAAGAGVLLFAEGISKLAMLTPGELRKVISSVREFFEEIGHGISSGMHVITQTVIDGLTALRMAAINIARGFIPDLISALFGGSKSVESVANKAGYDVSMAWVNGFRIPVGWHSPPEIIKAFFNDTIKAVRDEEKPLGDVLSQNAKIASGRFAKEFSGFDISNITKGFGSDAISGLISGLQSGEGPLSGEINNILNMFGVLQGAANTLASVGYSTTQSMFLTDLNHDLNTVNTRLERINTNLKTASGTTKNNLIITQTELRNEQGKLEQKIKDVTNAATGSKSAFDDLSKSLNGVGTSSKGAGSGVKDLQSTLQSTLESQMNIFSKFEAKSAMSKEELLNNMRSQIEGMTNWATQMQQLATMGIDKGLYQKLAEMGPQGAEYVGAFANMTAEELQQANVLWAQSLVLPGQVASMVSGSFNSIGTNVALGYANGITAEQQAAVNAAHVMAEETANEVDTFNDSHSPSRLYMQKGEWIDEGLAQGIDNLSHLPVNMIIMMANEMLSTARSKMSSDKYSPIGAGIVEGIQSGIDSRKDGIYSTLSEIADKVESTLRKALDVNSPSKRMIPIGSGITEGLAVGVEKGYSYLDNSLFTVGDMAVESMKLTVANIASTLANEIEDPVITPVLDLSKVQAGVRTLNNTISANQAVGARASFNNLQNGQLSGNGNIIFNQVNNSPKALSRIEIYRDTRNLFAQAKGALS